MVRRKTFWTALMLGGAVGLAPAASWAQGTTGGAPRSMPEQSRPGATENVPGSRSAAQELSQNDMKLIQQRLQEKGYQPGNLAGTADDTTRAAIKKFQQEEGISATGTIDELTANRLGFQYSKGPTERGGTAGDRPASKNQPPPR